MSSIHEQRPLSPHLQVYRPQITSVLSITHRATGIFLSIGSFILIAWLWAAAYNAEYFAFWQEMFASILGKVALTGWAFALFFHLGNGIRHLFWDIGRGFDLKNVTRSGIAVILFAIAMTAGVWACALHCGLNA